LPIVWSGTGTGYSTVATVLDLYSVQNGKIGTIAIQSGASGSYTWSIPPFPNTQYCTMQYPNGLCGTNLPDGQYYVKATLVSGNGFDGGSQLASANSGTFSIGGSSTTNGSVTASVQSGYAPLTVTFSVANSGGYFMADFGDGSTASLQTGSVTHVYSTPGTYKAEFSNDALCAHQQPLCPIYRQVLGSVTVTVY
jgi:PKD repeat protein